MEFFATGPTPSAAPRTVAVPWCVLLVDDDAEVHDVTRLALRKFEFQQRGLELLSAYSAREAQQMFQDRKDIALAVIDVVMETEHAGLELVRWLRETGLSPLTRLVLRTGQAGLAPEEQVIRQFDIDAYKEKTELTTLKLRSVLYTSLRNFRALAEKDADLDSLRALLRELPSLRAGTQQEAALKVQSLLRSRFQLEAVELTLPSRRPWRTGVSAAALEQLDPQQQAWLDGWLDALASAWPDTDPAT
jgi:CheY-like chemotaxis protein